MTMYSLDDTITAIATSIGQSGVGIIKMSGPEAYAIAWQIFCPVRNIKALKPYQLHYGQIIDPTSHTLIDEALVVYMPAPHSYTRQAVVEIQSHGSLVALRQILQLTLRLGARLAEAGEMTLRAFLNGRLDLAQAEAVLDIIEAKTEAALRVAAEQLEGTLSTQVSAVRQKLLDTLAFLEASVDFVEDEILAEPVIEPLMAVVNDLTKLLQNADRGLIYRQGLRVAIVGRPNVGKSSLLNGLLQDNRAIVTNIPGTTRDTLEETVNMGGVPVVLVDTAGIRAAPTDEVERIGVARSQAAIARADVTLLVIDGSQPLTSEDWEIEALVRAKSALLVINKCDLPNQIALSDLANFLPHAPHLPISALKNEGLTSLESAIVELALGGQITLADTPLVSHPRHKALLHHALDSTNAAIAAQQTGLSPDLVSIDVRAAVDALGEITGQTVTDDLLETIFSKFCIGK